MRPDRHRHQDSRSKGSVLVILLAISAVAAVLGGGMITLGYQSRVRATRATQQMAARVAADAGLTKAMHTLTSQFAAGSLNPLRLPSEMDIAIPNSKGTFAYTVSQDGLGGYTIVSTGACQNARVSVEGVVTGAGMTHEYAVLNQSDLVLRNSATVDWHNGESGESSLKVGTNSTEANKVVLYNRSHINGDVVVGAGSDPDDVIWDKGGSYDGAYAQSVSQPVPPVVVPDYLVSSSGKGPITSDTTITKSGKYAAIDLGNSKTLTIDGQVELYVTGAVTLKKSAEIVINEGASLVLYVDGNVEGKNDSKFNNETQDPRRFKLMGTASCTDVELKNSGDMYAIIYAPQADMILHNSAEVRGAITANTCELKSGASLYYDASLANYQDPLLIELKLARWREY
jgi:hypothetical protein